MKNNNHSEDRGKRKLKGCAHRRTTSQDVLSNKKQLQAFSLQPRITPAAMKPWRSSQVLSSCHLCRSVLHACSAAFVFPQRFFECLLHDSLSEPSHTPLATIPGRALQAEHAVLGNAYPRSYLAGWCCSHHWLAPFWLSYQEPAT